MGCGQCKPLWKPTRSVHVPDPRIAADLLLLTLQLSVSNSTFPPSRIRATSQSYFFASTTSFNDFLSARALLKDIGLNAKFLGDTARVDGLIIVPAGNIAIEGKRKEKDNVKALEAEEVLGKGAEYNPVGYVTFGYPDFTEEAQKNATMTKITLINVTLLGEILLSFWEGKTSREKIVQLLLSGKYISDLSEFMNR